MRAPPGLFATGLMTIGCWVRGARRVRTVVAVHARLLVELNLVDFCTVPLGKTNCRSFPWLSPPPVRTIEL